MRTFPARVLLLALTSPLLAAAPATRQDPPATRAAIKDDATTADRELVCRLEHLIPEVPFEGAALGDAFDFLRDVSGTDIVVDWKNLYQANIERWSKVNVKARNVRVSKAIRMVLNNVAGEGKLISHEQDGRLLISTPEAMPGMLRIFKPMDLTAVSPELRRKLDKLILPAVDFSALPLTQAKAFIEDLAGLKFEVDLTGYPANALIDCAVAQSSTVKQVHVYQAIRYIFAATNQPVEIVVRGERVFVVPVVKADGK